MIHLLLMKRFSSDDETFQIPFNQQECFVLTLCSSLCVQYLLVLVEGAAGLSHPGFMDLVFQVHQSLCGLSEGFSVLQLSSLSTPEPAETVAKPPKHRDRNGSAK